MSSQAEYRETLFPGGLRLVTARMPHMASVAVGIWAGVGGRHEAAAVSGISHFIEHLLFKGTRRRSAEQISRAVEGVGGYLNAFTDEEHTCFHARARADRLPVLLDVLFDMYLDSRFEPAEITRERAVILEELAMYRDQPAEHVQDLLNAAQFPGHPLGRPVLGSEATLRALRRPAFLRHLESHYVAGSTLVAVTGAVEHAAVEEFVRRHLRRFRPGRAPEPEPYVAPPGPPTLAVEQRPVEQAQLCLGLRACSRHDPRRHALRLLNALLGENMSSRLFQVIRERHGLTYHIGTSASTWADVGDLTVSAGLDPDELSRTLRLILRELGRLVERAPGAGEVRRARDYVLGQFDLSLENTEHHLMWLGEHWLNYGAPPDPDAVRRQLGLVTRSAIHRVARDFLGPAGRTLALVLPGECPAGIHRMLSAG